MDTQQLVDAALRQQWRCNGAKVRCRFCGTTQLFAWYDAGLQSMRRHQCEGYDEPRYYRHDRQLKHVMSIEPRIFVLRRESYIAPDGSLEEGDAS